MVNPCEFSLSSLSCSHLLPWHDVPYFSNSSTDTLYLYHPLDRAKIYCQARTAKYLVPLLSNISRSKGNQTMKFGQLIECNMRNIFLQKVCTKCGGETSP